MFAPPLTANIYSASVAVLKPISTLVIYPENCDEHLQTWPRSWRRSITPPTATNLTNSKLFYRIGKGNLAAVEVNQLRGKLVLLCDNEELNSSHFKPGDGYCL